MVKKLKQKNGALVVFVRNEYRDFYVSTGVVQRRDVSVLNSNKFHIYINQKQS